MRRTVVSSAAVAMLAAPLATAVAVATPPPGASLSEVARTPRSVELTARDGARRGELRLVVHVRRAGKLSARFHPAAGGEALSVAQAPPAAAAEERLAVSGALPADRLERGDVVALVLTFTLREKAKPSALDGVLRLATATDAPLLVPVKGTEKAAGPRWTFEQDKTELTVTQMLGPLSSGDSDSRTIPLRDAQPKEPPGAKPLATTAVAFDGAGTASAELAPPPAGEAEIKNAIVNVANADGHGAATAKLRLGEGKRQELEMTLRLRHFILWPLVVIAAGAWFGMLLPRRRDIRRRARLVASELKQAYDEYATARKPANRSGAPNLTDLQGVEASPRWVRGPRNWRRPRLWPAKGWFAEPPKDGVGGVYSRLGRARNADELEDELAAAQELISRMQNWRSIDAALRNLKDAIREAAPAAGQTDTPRPLNDAQQLFAETFDVPGDTTAGAAEAARINAQASALRLYTLAAPLHAELSDHEQKLPDDDDRRRLARSDPLTIYLRHSPGRRRTAAAGDALVAELGDVLDELRYLKGRLPADEAVKVEAAAHDLPVMVGVTSVAERAAKVAEWLGRLVAPQGAPSREAVLAGVRRGDRLQFWGTVLVSALVYLLPLYVGKSWGSLGDYATAFAAGFAGQVVVAEALIPFMRSLRGFPPQQPAAAAG